MGKKLTSGEVSHLQRNKLKESYVYEFCFLIWRRNYIFLNVAKPLKSILFCLNPFFKIFLLFASNQSTYI